jgi:hypothetical protein
MARMGRCDAIAICSAAVRLPGIKDHRYRHRFDNQKTCT